MVCTAATTFSLVSMSTWIAYKKWIAPVMLSRLPLLGLETGNKSRDRLPAHGTPARTLPRRSRTGSFSESLDSFIFSDRSSAHSPRIWNAIRSSFPSPDRDRWQSPFRDLENVAPAQQTADHTNQQPPNSLRMKAVAVSVVHSATRLFWQGTARGVPRMVQTPTTPDVNSSLSRTSCIPVPPSKFDFPHQPQRVLKHVQWEVRDLEYSPGGLVLAVTSFDCGTRSSVTVIYYDIEADIPRISRHRHLQGRISKQVAWSRYRSHHENILLVRLDHSIDLLSVDTNMSISLNGCIKRQQSIESAAWCTSSSILSVEGSIVFKLSLDGHVGEFLSAGACCNHVGQVIASYNFVNILVRDIAMLPNTELLLVVGRVMHKDMLPKNSRAEKQLILYDMKNKEYKSRNPVLDDMRYITLADHISLNRLGFGILVGHKNKRSPQVWTLIPHRDGSHQLKPNSGVRLRPFDLAGPGYLAGDQQQIISCVDSGGNIYIWDRESGILAHRIPAQVVMGGRRCIAWSATQANSVHFATVGKNELRIWTATQTDPVLPSESPRQSPSALTIPHSPLASRNLLTPLDISTFRNISAGEPLPSPRSALSMNIHPTVPDTSSEPDPEGFISIKVEKAD